MNCVGIIVFNVCLLISSYSLVGTDVLSTVFTVCLTCKGRNLNVTFTLSPSYPESPPLTSISSKDLSKQQCTEIKTHLDIFAQDFLNEPMLLQLISHVEANFENCIKDDCNREVNISFSSEKQMALLHLDHMRNRSKYVKTLLRWTEEFDLKGRLIFCGKLILILIQGDAENIKVLDALNKYFLKKAILTFI